MKERGILFKGHLVREILADRKDVTRRLLNPQPPSVEDVRKLAGIEYHLADIGTPGVWRPMGPVWAVRKLMGGSVVELGHKYEAKLTTWRCPYGTAGDRLWVRETWYCDNYTERDFARARIGDVTPRTDEQIIAEWREALYYRADAERTGTICELIPECECEGRSPWKPGIHMPRWASRITLDVVTVRVERLQDITEDDARREGVTEGLIPADEHGPVRVGYVLGPDDGKCVLYPTARRAFEVGWDAINGDRASWASNPWVWRVEFKRVPSARSTEQAA